MGSSKLGFTCSVLSEILHKMSSDKTGSETAEQGIWFQDAQSLLSLCHKTVTAYTGMLYTIFWTPQVFQKGEIRNPPKKDIKK